jgi:hypothetical protein
LPAGPATGIRFCRVTIEFIIIIMPRPISLSLRY